MKKRILQWIGVVGMMVVLIGLVGACIPANPATAWAKFYIVQTGWEAFGDDPEAELKGTEYTWDEDNIELKYIGPFHVAICDEPQFGTGVSVSFWGKWLRVW